MKVLVDIDVAAMEDDFLRRCVTEAERRGLIPAPLPESACQSALRRAYANLVLNQTREALTVLAAHVPTSMRPKVAESGPQGGQVAEVAEVAGPENKGFSAPPATHRPPSPATSATHSSRPLRRQLPAKRGQRHPDEVIS